MIGILIHEKLTTYQPLVDLIGEQVYPLSAPEDVDAPFVVYDVRYFAPEYVKSIVFSGKGVVDSIMVTINVSHINYKGMQYVVDAVRTTLEGSTLTYGSITTKQIQVHSIAEGFNPRSRTYITKIEFQFLTNKIIL